MRQPYCGLIWILLIIFYRICCLSLFARPIRTQSLPDKLKLWMHVFWVRLCELVRSGQIGWLGFSNPPPEFVINSWSCILQLLFMSVDCTSFQVLFFVDPMDEVAIQNLKSYKEKNFVDISKEDLDIGKLISFDWWWPSLLCHVLHCSIS